MESRENYLRATGQLGDALAKQQELIHRINKHDAQLPELLPLVREHATLQVDLEVAAAKLKFAQGSSEKSVEIIALSNRLRELKGEPVLPVALDSELAEAEANYALVKGKLDAVSAQIELIKNS